MSELKKILIICCVVLSSGSTIQYHGSEVDSFVEVPSEEVTQTSEVALSEEVDETSETVLSEEVDETSETVLSEEVDETSEEALSEEVTQASEEEVTQTVDTLVKNSEENEQETVASSTNVNQEVTHYSDGTIKTRTYYENGKRTKLINYDSLGHKQTMYTFQNNGKVYTKYYYNTNGTQKRSYRYDSYGRKTSSYEYKTINGKRTIEKHWTYLTNGHKSSYKQFYSNGHAKVSDSYKSGRLNKQVKYNSSGHKTEMYTFQSNGRVYTKYYYNSNGTQHRSYRYDSRGRKTSAYEYKTVNGKRVIVKKWNYTTSGKKASYQQYRNHGELIRSEDYYSNGRVKYRIIYHYQKNNVNTGTTKTWFTSSGKVKKIDAEVNTTYYTQYTKEYKKYSCPAYNGDMYKHGCIMNAMAMYYSVYFNDELTPKELYKQGYHCFFDVEKAYARNGLNVREVKVKGSNRNAYTSFYNRNNAIPNGKSTFTIQEALVDYGMPVQLMMRSNGHIANNFPGHSIVAYRYVYENGKSKIYARDPGAKGPTVNLQNYMDGKYHEYGANWYLIKNAWVGGVK